MLKVLSINTYAGSLLLAAKQAKLEVVASLEDSGFGSDLQALNFPKVPRFETTAEWPDQLEHPWLDTLVIAHPPCAAFSNQNSTMSTRGVDAGSFQCHRDVLAYALGHGCAALAIESVPGTIAAREVYDAAAAQHGYYVFYVKQNAVSFGVPQWRPRLWMIFLKKDSLNVVFKPKYTILQDVLKQEEDYGGYSNQVARHAGVLHRYRDEWRGNLLDCLSKEDGQTSKQAGYNGVNVREKYNLHGAYKSSLATFMDPMGFCPVICKESLLYANGKSFSRQDYARVMGFPADYKFGTTRHGEPRNDFRMMLSKGICPPVGVWILKLIKNNVERPKPLRLHRLLDAPADISGTQHYLVPSGEVLNLNPKRADAQRAALQKELAL